jgi:hypothetical protein
MHTDIMGDDILGDDLEGDFLEGDDIEGDYLVGEDLMGADELLGADDIMGDDLVGDDLVGDYLVGAAVRRKRRARQAAGTANPAAARKALVRKAILAKRLRNAAIVHKRPPSRSRIQPLGFNREAIPAGETIEITARPQVLFRPHRLIVGSSIAANFMIEDVKIGRASQFAGSGAQTAEAFKDTAGAGARLNWDTCNPGVDITMTVRNFTGAASDFRATLFGDVVD